MSKYKNIEIEDNFKIKVFHDYFKAKGVSWGQKINEIDFFIKDDKNRKKDDNDLEKNYIWMEAKGKKRDVYDMLTQLVLTIKKILSKYDYDMPPYLGCFDTEKIAFVRSDIIYPIFNINDFNWKVKPSCDPKSKEFIKARKALEKIIDDNIDTFVFSNYEEEIKNFIKNNILTETDSKVLNKIDKNNFIIIFNKWLKDVKNSISIDWTDIKKMGLIEGDFYLADLLSTDNLSLKEKLSVLLENNKYKMSSGVKEVGLQLFAEISFRDEQKAHKEFWNKYRRLLLEEYWEYIVKQRDILVPQDIRERKGSFFTPQVWVELSQKYIADVFGENWQDKYYIWDCAAGTGNLLAGLVNKYNIWASTIDKPDVDVMKDRIKHGANLIKDHIFQFDFLNDDFKILPKALKDIIDDPEKRKKLIVYINPPFAEVSSVGGKGKKGVNKSEVHNKYTKFLGTAGRELFAQFLLRIYKEIPDCKLATFGTLKYVTGSAFEKFRETFKAKYKKGFICPADTFDNVPGKFPIGFLIWDTNKKEKFKSVISDIYDKDGRKIGHKNYYCFNKNEYINKWISSYKPESKETIGFLAGTNSNDFQQNQIVYILNNRNQMSNPRGIEITKNNVFEICIYYAIRHCIILTWLNNQDQFLCPNNKWKKDQEFQNNSLMYTIFDTDIKSEYGINHWIPFTESEVNARDNFESHFMSELIAGKIKIEKDLFDGNKINIKGKLKFSKEAKDVFNAGKEIWKYYHSFPIVDVNASLHDIKGYFQGYNKKGHLNIKESTDVEYNKLLAKLRESLKILAKKIEPKVYKYGFLK